MHPGLEQRLDFAPRSHPDALDLLAAAADHEVVLPGPLELDQSQFRLVPLHPVGGLGVAQAIEVPAAPGQVPALVELGFVVVGHVGIEVVEVDLPGLVTAEERIGGMLDHRAHLQLDTVDRIDDPRIQHQVARSHGRDGSGGFGGFGGGDRRGRHQADHAGEQQQRGEGSFHLLGSADRGGWVWISWMGSLTGTGPGDQARHRLADLGSERE